jgi:hypothetical protein
MINFMRKEDGGKRVNQNSGEDSEEYKNIQ